MSYVVFVVITLVTRGYVVALCPRRAAARPLFSTHDITLLQRTRRDGTIISLDLFLRFADIRYYIQTLIISLHALEEFLLIFSSIIARYLTCSRVIVAWFLLSHFSLSLSLSLVYHTHTLGTASPNIVLLAFLLFLLHAEFPFV